MKAELIKVDNGWVLMVDNVMYATDNDKLSLKNCQAIENGYDLDELAEESRGKGGDFSSLHYFKKGFQKALELLGDKKYSDEDLDKAVNLAYVSGGGDDSYKECEELVKEHLNQQTEWDVEICCYVEEDDDTDSFISPMLTNTGIPKLDVDGCLILKRTM